MEVTREGIDAQWVALVWLEISGEGASAEDPFPHRPLSVFHLTLCNIRG